MHTMGYGSTSAVNDEVFNWVFNHPANDWDAAFVAIKYLLDENGGSLEVATETMESWGAPSIGPEFSVSCQDHGGSGTGGVQQWTPRPRPGRPSPTPSLPTRRSSAPDRGRQAGLRRREPHHRGCASS